MRIGIDIRNIGKNRTGDEVVFFNLVKNLAKMNLERNSCIDKIDTLFYTVIDNTKNKNEDISKTVQ